MRILGIETSCDETAAAVVEGGVKVLSNVIASSVDMHTQTGGVVPEVAAREHLRQITPVIDKALADAKVGWNEIDAVAVTCAPGLIASLLVGVNSAQAIAYIRKKPLIPVHHIAGHIYANFLWGEAPQEPPQFPLLVLTVSGGHNELVLMRGHHDFEVLGETLDDAAGEAFDKVARLLGLGYPGGPIISRRAEEGYAYAYDFPRPMLDGDNRLNFSFSGLKSAVRREVAQIHGENGKGEPTDEQINNIAASFQLAVVETLAEKLALAVDDLAQRGVQVREVHLAGGVSANQMLRKVARERIPEGIPLKFPAKLIYCTDNAAMIAGAAHFLPEKPKGWRNIHVSSQADL